MTISGTYDLVVDEAWQYVNTDELRIDCDTSAGAVIINLPEISELLTEKEIKLVKLFIVDASANAATNNITINPGGLDTIIGESPLVIDVDGGGVNLQIGNSTNWIEYGDVPAATLTEYDSGWKDLIAFDALKGFGFAANGLYPKIRIINRNVFIQGVISIPLAVAGNLQNDATIYPTIASNSVWLGNDGGYFDDDGILRSRARIIPETLDPELITNSTPNINFIKRTIYLSDGTTKYPVISATYGVQLGSNGLLYIPTLNYIETDNLSADYPFSNLRNAVSKFNSGDIAIDYTNYRNSYDGAGVLQQNPLNSGLTFPFPFDPSDAYDYGGFVVQLNFNYLIASTTSLADIKAAFDAI